MLVRRNTYQWDGMPTGGMGRLLVGWDAYWRDGRNDCGLGCLHVGWTAAGWMGGLQVDTVSRISFSFGFGLTWVQGLGCG